MSDRHVRAAFEQREVACGGVEAAARQTSLEMFSCREMSQSDEVKCADF